MGNCHDCKAFINKTEFALEFSEEKEDKSFRKQAVKDFSALVPIASKLVAMWRGYNERKLFSHIYKQSKPEYSYFDISEVKESLSKQIGLASYKEKRKEYKLKSGKYTGEWCGGFRQGYGIMQWQDGSKYEGYWMYSRPHGTGKFIYKNGEGYSGNWKAYFVFSKSIFKTGKLEQWKECVQDGYCNI